MASHHSRNKQQLMLQQQQQQQQRAQSTLMYRKIEKQSPLFHAVLAHARDIICEAHWNEKDGANRGTSSTASGKPPNKGAGSRKRKKAAAGKAQKQELRFTDSSRLVNPAHGRVDDGRMRAHLTSLLDDEGLSVQLRNAIYFENRKAQQHKSGTGSGSHHIIHPRLQQGVSHAMKKMLVRGNMVHNDAAHVGGVGDPAADATLLHLPVPPVPELTEPIDIVDAARRQWDTRLRFELRNVATKQKRKLLRVRNMDDDTVPDYLIRFVYTSEDLLETLASIANPNSASAARRVLDWSVIKVALDSPSMFQLRSKYWTLSPDVRQVGVDDTVMGLEWFRKERLETGAGLETSDIASVRQFCQTGVPTSLRPRIWSHVMGISNGKHARRKRFAYFDSLIEHVQDVDMITDDLARFDVQDTADNDCYFVFEESLDEIMLAFSRDMDVPKHCTLDPNSVPLTISSQHSSLTSRTSTTITHQQQQQSRAAAAATAVTRVPPNAIIPFHRQCMFAAPLCFFFEKTEDTYFLFRALYCRYFCRLHVISSQPDSILYLARMFDDLLQERNPNLFFHCINCGVKPLSIAFPWIFSAFSGFLGPVELLQLWDRLIGYDSLEIVVLLAVAIFLFRSKSVLQCTTTSEIQDVFAELSSLQVIPLLQQFLHGRLAR